MLLFLRGRTLLGRGDRQAKYQDLAAKLLMEKDMAQAGDSAYTCPVHTGSCNREGPIVAYFAYGAVLFWGHSKGSMI